jgi:hypothetical protein
MARLTTPRGGNRKQQRRQAAAHECLSRCQPQSESFDGIDTLGSHLERIFRSEVGTSKGARPPVSVRAAAVGIGAGGGGRCRRERGLAARAPTAS